MSQSFLVNHELKILLLCTLATCVSLYFAEVRSYAICASAVCNTATFVLDPDVHICLNNSSYRNNIYSHVNFMPYFSVAYEQLQSILAAKFSQYLLI